MKILQINNHHENVGGAESVYLNTIKLLRKNGNEVISLSRGDSGSVNSADGNYLIKYSSSFYKRFYSGESSKLIEKIIREEKPEIIHLHNIVGGITYSILPVIKKHNIPVVMSVHDFRLLCPVAIYLDGAGNVCEKCKGDKYYNCITNNCSPEGLTRSIGIALESYLRDSFFPYADYIDHFIFVSDFAKNKFLEAKPQLRDKSTRIYNFTNNFSQNNCKGNYYLFFGRLAREKGLITLIESFKKHPELKLKIAGAGVLGNAIEDMLTPNIELLGYKTGNELADIIKNSSFIITPTECYETLSMSTVEAFAMGKPVIGTNIGALSELIKNGKTGFVFNPKDSGILSQLVLKASKLNAEEYSLLSNNVFEFASANFTADKYYKQLMNVYDRVLG